MPINAQEDTFEHPVRGVMIQALQGLDVLTAFLAFAAESLPLIMDVERIAAIRASSVLVRFLIMQSLTKSIFSFGEIASNNFCPIFVAVGNIIKINNSPRTASFPLPPHPIL